MVLGQRLRHRFVFSLAGNAAFVAASEIEYRKKRLPFLAPPPMGLAAGLIPGVLGRAKLIIRFGIIRAVISRIAQGLRERPDGHWQLRPAAHVVCTQRRLVHAGDNSRPARCAHAR